MDKTSIGDRMKGNYENSFKTFLPKRMPVIIRLDGKAFHTFTRGMKKPFDENLIDAMNKTAIYLCENIQNAQIAYVQSDEISILLNNYKRLNTQSWFGNELQKIVSVSAGMASSYFSLEFGRLAAFDSRAFVLPESEVCNYFIWRQQDWERNSIQLLAQSLYSSKELHKKKCSDLQEMCFQKGQNWNNLNTNLKRGRCTIKYEGGWITDNVIPIFKKERDYIENLLKIED
jgi:tRNA(His) 5'-end guanylyltransferase